MDTAGILESLIFFLSQVPQHFPAQSSNNQVPSFSLFQIPHVPSQALTYFLTLFPPLTLEGLIVN